MDIGSLAEGLSLGDSVAVNGACLTVAELNGRRGEFDVVAETLQRTTLGLLRTGRKVNLEKSMTLDQTVGGHLVQGHVDGVAEVRSIDKSASGSSRQWLLELSAPTEITDLMVAKGSVALDGVSLTLVDVCDDLFSVALIPTTLAETNLGELAVGSKVNVEADVIGKYVRRYLHQMATKPAATLTLEKLKEAGFA